PAEVAQPARAGVSYAPGRGFDSLLRHHSSRWGCKRPHPPGPSGPQPSALAIGGARSGPSPGSAMPASCTMPIPKAVPPGILPPSLKSAARRGDVPPYLATPLELVERYATSKQRIHILEGLLAYRAELRRVGLGSGFQCTACSRTGSEPCT